jgi:hypothetical protein
MGSGKVHPFGSRQQPLPAEGWPPAGTVAELSIDPVTRNERDELAEGGNDVGPWFAINGALVGGVRRPALDPRTRRLIAVRGVNGTRCG